MKTIKFILLYLILCLSSCVFSQKHKSIKLLNSTYIKINDTLFADIYEVTNENYKNFLGDLKRDSSLELYQKCMYDTSQWMNKFSFLCVENLRDKYHTHSFFDSFPIVNISWFAANKYCDWLTEKYKSTKRPKDKNLLFKLPSEYEWRIMVDGDNTGFPKGFGSGRDEYGYYKANTNTLNGNYDTIAVDGGYFMVWVKAYVPNRLGIYQIIGNVSEMTDVKDIVKGGDWWTTIADCAIDKSQTIDTPDPRVGFRVVAIVIK